MRTGRLGPQAPGVKNLSVVWRYLCRIPRFKMVRSRFTSVTCPSFSKVRSDETVVVPVQSKSQFVTSSSFLFFESRPTPTRLQMVHFTTSLSRYIAVQSFDRDVKTKRIIGILLTRYIIVINEISVSYQRTLLNITNSGYLTGLNLSYTNYIYYRLYLTPIQWKQNNSWCCNRATEHVLSMSYTLIHR